MEEHSISVKRPRRRTVDAVVAAASELFLEQGYGATTVEAIASRAGVAVQTIYNALGSKSEVLLAVVAAALRGDEERSPREFVRERARRAATGREMLGVAVAFWMDVRQRSEPLFRVVREAAATDREIAALEQELDTRRLESMRVAARDLEQRGWLRDGLDVESAAVTLWALSHVSAYRLLLEGEHWPRDRYASWLEDTLCGALLRDAG